MTVSNSTTVDKLFSGERKLFLVILIALPGAVAVGLLMANEPLLAAGVLLSIPLLLVLLKLPDAATLLVVFYIYANVGPVLIRFHGVPSYISQGFPVVLIIPLIWYLLLRRETLIITPVFYVLLMLLVVYILGAAFSSDISLTTRKLIDYLFEGVLLYFFLTNVIRTPLMLKRVVWVLLISGALIGGLSLYQQVTGTFDNNYGGFAQVAGSFGTGEENLQGEIEQSRLMGSIGEQNRYAQNMLMLVPLGLFQLWIHRSTRMRILAIILTGLIIIGGALAFSRGAAVGFVIMILIFVLLRYIKFYQFLLLVLGAVLVLWMFPQYTVRLQSLSALSDAAASSDGSVSLAGADGAIRGRATDMLAALLIFRDHPLVGVGPDMVRYYTQDYSRDIGFRYLTNNPQAHSLFPGIAAESGILGLICFLLILYIPLRDLVRARNRWRVSRPDLSYLATAFFQVLISYIVTGLFLHMAFMRFFFLMIALAVVASSFKDEDTLAEAKTTETALVAGK
jgi:putative inorganic carbon (hco3(-)) transporter